MFLIVSYDVEECRVGKVYNYLKTWLSWRQNSIFEGELTQSQYFELISGLREIIDEDKDSVYFYCIPSKKNVKFHFIGIEKTKTERII